MKKITSIFNNIIEEKTNKTGILCSNEYTIANGNPALNSVTGSTVRIKA